MAKKYLRALPYTTSTNGRDIPILLKLCYEFWGYCVNGTSSLTSPGGMPTASTSGPAGFFEGSSVLATGNDGETSANGINFTSVSANFNKSTMTNKYITIWSHTDTESTDNSIYKIINVISPTQLMLAPFSGGTPDISTLKNNLTSRSALNYRIIDPVAASQLSVSNGNYFVGTLSDAYTINPEQANSQFQIILRGASSTFGLLGIVGSPDGTWNGSVFTGNNLTERTTSNASYTVGTSGQNGFITMIADKTFFIAHLKSNNGSLSSGYYFFITTPQRLYTQAQDPNPLAIMLGSNSLLSTAVTESIATSFGMVGNDGTTRSYDLLTRNLVSDGYNSGNTDTGGSYTVGPNLFSEIALPSRINQLIYSYALLSNSSTAGQFNLARAKLQPIAFTSNTFPLYHLVGNNGEFIHVGNGLLFPWDGTMLPFNILPLGA